MRLLLLAGSAEARAIAAALVGDPRFTVIASLAGATRAPAPLAPNTRIGGFGGADGLARYLRDERIDAAINATHPFAAVMSATTAQVAAEMRLPALRVLRAGWTPRAGDNWQEIAAEAEAAAHVPKDATVFLATGRQTLCGFANMTGRRLICRQIDPPDGPFPFPGGRFEVGRPPFSVENEIALFRRLGVEFLVVKNAGGAASATKLDAARALGIPVLMIRRPPPPEGEIVTDAQQAIAWAQGLVA